MLTERDYHNHHPAPKSRRLRPHRARQHPQGCLHSATTRATSTNPSMRAHARIRRRHPTIDIQITATTMIPRTINPYLHPPRYSRTNRVNHLYLAPTPHHGRYPSRRLTVQLSLFPGRIHKRIFRRWLQDLCLMVTLLMQLLMLCLIIIIW